MKKTHYGFTLIELMIVIAIIGILAAVALPAYQDYTVRTKVSEGLTLASGAKTTVTETRLSMGRWMGAANSSYGMATAASIEGNNVASITVAANGRIVITYSNDAAIQGDTLALVPTVSAGSVEWSCRLADGGDVVAKYRPANCR